MRRVGPVLLVVASSMLLAASWRELMAPGLLGRAHDGFAGDCDQCHLVFDGVPDAKCLDCHTTLAERIAAGTGFHAANDGACVDCHTDHHGLDGALTEAEALAAFDHEATGFSLQGAHGTQACEDCHDVPLGELGAVCGSCHDDPHSSALGPACDTCHVELGWLTQLKTLDAHLVDTEGGHSGLGCEDCHLHGEHLSTQEPCAGCHEQGHGGTQMACDFCHEVSGFTPAKFDHGPCTCAFPGKHQTVECLDCHADFVFVDTPTLCSGCHLEDRLHDDLGECSQCHDALSWSDSQFDHGTTAFALTGAHLSVSCSQCHTEPGVFGGQPTACSGCHQELGVAAHGDFGECTDCHSTAGFDENTFDHAAVSFPLTGRHATLGCPQCHLEKTEGYAPRP
jgi:hypothetical protein